MSRTCWGYNTREARLYQFFNSTARASWLELSPTHQLISAQDSFVADFRNYCVKFGKQDAVRDFISPDSPLKGV